MLAAKLTKQASTGTARPRRSIEIAADDEPDQVITLYAPVTLTVGQVKCPAKAT